MKRFFVVSLGCPKNLVDTEYICERFMDAGYTLVSDEHHADVVVVNTCAFLTSAVEESIEEILEAAGPGKDVICTGCLVSRYQTDLLRELPEVALFAGPGSYGGIVKAYEAHARYLAPSFSTVVKRSFTSGRKSAYVKVSEGCSNRCGYCLIPSLRGSLVSKPVQDVLDECRALADSGVIEVILVAQDLGAYGSDLGMRNGLADLVERIAGIETLRWVRLMYVHPASLTEALVEQLEGNHRVCPYVDLPIQHVSGRVLE
ncbi:MAG TPA: radical SAM protein, partial [Deltaproteobacteria bacterium]|nr:radical SAM protein [Deltaproteobacteria bacterium]